MLNPVPDIFGLGDANNILFDDDDDEQDLELLNLLETLLEQERQPTLFRERWREDYLRGLAQRENSFVMEYRMNPSSFNILVEMLEPLIAVDNKMAALSLHRSGSQLISPSSRVGACLIMLGGGRVMESMRTHGLSKDFCYKNLKKIVRAINSHPNLAIESDHSPLALKRKAKQFSDNCDHPDLFNYCVGAIDGIAISIECPPSENNGNIQNQTRLANIADLAKASGIDINILHNLGNVFLSLRKDPPSSSSFALKTISSLF
jgi:hypothetical protein